METKPPEKPVPPKMRIVKEPSPLLPIAFLMLCILLFQLFVLTRHIVLGIKKGEGCKSKKIKVVNEEEI